DRRALDERAERLIEEVVLPVHAPRESPHTQTVEVPGQHPHGLSNVFARALFHAHSELRLNLPERLTFESGHVRAELADGDLERATRTERRVEEEECELLVRERVRITIRFVLQSSRQKALDLVRLELVEAVEVAHCSPLRCRGR